MIKPTISLIVLFLIGFGVPVTAGALCLAPFPWVVPVWLITFVVVSLIHFRWCIQ